MRCLSQQVRRIDWIETAGEMGALLKEAQLIKRWQPVHNRRLRRSEETCTWRLLPVAGASDDEDAGHKPELIKTSDVDWSQAPEVYGLFNNQKDAVKTLREIAEGAQLCLATLGLDKLPAGRPCFGYQLQQCSGVCVGQESLASHAHRLRNVLSDWQVQTWPYPGPVKVQEGGDWHVLDAWTYLGSVQNDKEVQALLAQARPTFDKDTYKILVSWLHRVTPESV